MTTDNFIEQFVNRGLDARKQPEHVKQYKAEFDSLKAITEVQKISKLSADAEKVQRELIERMKKYYPRHKQYGLKK